MKPLKKKKSYTELVASHSIDHNGETENGHDKENQWVLKLKEQLEPFDYLLQNEFYHVSENLYRPQTCSSKTLKYTANTFIALGIVAAVAFQKSLFNNLKYFFEGHTLAGDDIPTEGFLEHFSIDNDITSIIAIILIYTLVVGDTLACFLTVNPFTSFDETTKLLNSHKPLSDTQVQQRNEAQQHASCAKRSADIGLLQALPILTNIMYFGVSSYPAVYGTQALLGDDFEPLGWVMFDGVGACFAGIYGKHLIRSVRRMRAAWYIPDESAWVSVWQNKHATWETMLHFIVVASLCGSKAMFLFDVMFDFTDPADWLDWSIFAAAIYSVWASRFLLMKDDFFAPSQSEFVSFCEHYYLRDRQGFILGQNIKRKLANSIISLSKGLFPGWLVGSIVHQHSYALQGWLQISLSLASGLLAGGLFCWSHYQILPRQYLIRDFYLHEKIIDLYDKLEPCLEGYVQLKSAFRIIVSQINQIKTYRKAQLEAEQEISTELLCYYEQLSRHHQCITSMQHDVEHMLWMLARFDKELFPLTPFEEKMQHALQFFHYSQPDWNQNARRIPYVLATATNVLSNAAHQLLLVHFFIVTLIRKCGAENSEENLSDLYDGALAFSASSGLSLFINGLAVYQEVLVLRYSQICDYLGNMFCRKQEDEIFNHDSVLHAV